MQRPGIALRKAGVGNDLQVRFPDSHEPSLIAICVPRRKWRFCVLDDEKNGFKSAMQVVCGPIECTKI